MPRTKQSKGKCVYCEQENAKSGMLKHLSTCAKRQELIASVEGISGTRESLFHLRVQDNWKKDFWLDLEMRESATLNDLDRYLRGIWLECCGHLSEFTYGGWQSSKVGMKRRAVEVFEPGVELTHIYDFGTSSETLVKVAGMREGKPTTARPIALMARNLPPEYPCIECNQPATLLCWECLIEDSVWGVLCDEHAGTHPHHSYDEPMPLVNSPRVGMCGYTGPAEPPY